MLKRLNFLLPKFQKKFSLSAVAGVVVGGSVHRKKAVKMEESYVTINKVPTHIFTWGKSLDEKFDEKTKEMVIVITGNPGLPGFYTTFCSTLYEELEKEMPIWVIGHAGHDEPNRETKMKTPPLKGNEDLYDLEGQLEHKIEFYTRFVPKDVKIYLIGHSIGSHFCLDLLKKIPEFSKQVQHCYLLFPAIERMAESNKGKLVPSYDRWFFLFRVFYNILHLMPMSWKRSLVAWHCRKEGMIEEFLEPSVEYTNPPVIDKIWFLALDEMQKIREVDEDAIKTNMHRLKLYYGTKDDWVRTEYYHELVEKFPGIDAELCKQEFEHAFVLKTGIEVGKMVSEWMNLKRKVKE